MYEKRIQYDRKIKKVGTRAPHRHPKLLAEMYPLLNLLKKKSANLPKKAKIVDGLKGKNDIQRVPGLQSSH